MYDIHLVRRGGGISNPDFRRIQELCAFLTPERPPLSREAFEQTLALGTALVIAYKIERGMSTIVGMVTLCPIIRLGRREVLIEDVIVDHDHRRCGVGRLMINEVQRLAEILGIPTVRYVSGIPDLAAGRFLEAMKFVHSPSGAFVWEVP